MALVVASGLLTAHAVLGDWPISLSGDYRRLLAAKMLLVALMIGLALINGYALLPGFALNGAGTSRRMLLTTSAEFVLACLVLAAVAVLGNLTPME